MISNQQKQGRVLDVIGLDKSYDKGFNKRNEEEERKEREAREARFDFVANSILKRAKKQLKKAAKKGSSFCYVKFVKCPFFMEIYQRVASKADSEGLNVQIICSFYRDCVCLISYEMFPEEVNLKDGVEVNREIHSFLNHFDRNLQVRDDHIGKGFLITTSILITTLVAFLGLSLMVIR